MEHIKTALILCGGKGTRLRPITNATPKSLIPIQGKPLLEHIFDLLRKYQINSVLLAVGYLKEKIKDYFENNKSDMNISFIEEETPLGTAGPLVLLKKKYPPRETFIVSNGDELKNIDITKMYEFHKRNKALATIALTAVENPSLYGVVSLDGNRILEFLEKPKDPPTSLINAGFYILEPAVLEMIPEGFSMLEKDIFPKIAEKRRLYGFPFHGQWFDVGNRERCELAQEEWKGLSK